MSGYGYRIRILEFSSEGIPNAASDSSTKGSNDSKKKKKKEKKPRKKWPEELETKPKPTDTDKALIIDGVKYWWCLALNKWVKHGKVTVSLSLSSPASEVKAENVV